MDKITIVTFVNERAIEFAEYFKEISLLRCSNPKRIEWLFVQSGDLSRDPKGFKKIGVVGVGHYNALNYARDYKYDTDILIFCDADIVLLKKSWDTITELIMQENDLFGIAYPKISPSKYQNYPNTNFVVFNKNSMQYLHEIDFRDGKFINGEKVNRPIIQNNKESKIFNLPVGHKVSLDTGWMIPAVMKKHINRVKVLSPVIMTDSESQLPWSDLSERKKYRKSNYRMIEWHLDGELFGSHRYACRKVNFDSSSVVVWRNRIEKYINV